MATEFQFKVNLPKEFKQAANMFPKSGSAILNRKAKEVRTLMAKEVPQEFNVKAGDVRSKISLRNASPNNLKAVVQIRSNNFSLTQFLVSKKPTLHQEGVLVQVKRGKFTFLQSRTFVNNIKGKIAVLQRVGASRLPIQYRKSVSPATIFSSRSLKEKVSNFVNSTLPNDLAKTIKAFRILGRE